MHAPLFSFGTLMDTDLLALVSGQPLAELAVQRGWLPGYALRQVDGDHFPVLVLDQAATAEGRVIAGLSSIAMQRILFFEGDEYVLSPINVSLDTGIEAPCVFFKDAAIYQVTDKVWDFERWVADDKPGFIDRARHYMSYFGKLSATEADQHW